MTSSGFILVGSTPNLQAVVGFLGLLKDVWSSTIISISLQKLDIVILGNGYSSDDQRECKLY